MTLAGSEPSAAKPGAGPAMPTPSAAQSWADARKALRERGLRWTPQRRLILAVLAETSGHITGSDLVERCRARDAATIPSTVYRTLDVLEELGYVRHSHGADGREEYHVLPGAEHAHLRCLGCGAAVDIGGEEAHDLVDRLRATHGFTVVLSHVMIGGYCPGCGPADREQDGD
jgi:Fur family ferric uptake transcriptional regulator